MDLTTAAVKLALDSLKSAIKSFGSRVSRRRQRELTSTAIMELLKLDPNMDAVDAAIAAAEATGVNPSPDLFRAKRMRDGLVKRAKTTVIMRGPKIKVTKKRAFAKKGTRRIPAKSKRAGKKTTKKGRKAKR
ncbi:MAG: hypothetical protein KAW02_01915 [candidate division Zixibacteria bacterium]|nr:hypothetical protein [candidate division Zixibacteria bacterium]